MLELELLSVKFVYPPFAELDDVSPVFGLTAFFEVSYGFLKSANAKAAASLTFFLVLILKNF